MAEPAADPAPQPAIYLEFDRENIKALHKLLTELATFFDWNASSTVNAEAEEHLGIPDAADWLAETLTDHATHLDQALKAAEETERSRWQF